MVGGRRGVVVVANGLLRSWLGCARPERMALSSVSVNPAHPFFHWLTGVVRYGGFYEKDCVRAQ